LRKLFIPLIFCPIAVFSQWNTRYTQGYFVELGGFSKGGGINYHRMLFPTKKSFVSGSIGLSYVWGASSIPNEPNPFGYENSGLGIPVTLTYNYFIGHIDHEIAELFNTSCYKRPPKVLIDWFAEAGAGAVPAFYNRNSNEKNRVVPHGYLGIRTQVKKVRPYKENDLVLFARMGVSPFYYKQNLHMSSLGSVSFSLGWGF
jgi:hypothetical protein